MNFSGYITENAPCSSCRSKLYKYDDVVEKVVQHLGLDDPSKIRLTSHSSYSQQPMPQPINYRGVEHLSDMLVHNNQVWLWHHGFFNISSFMPDTKEMHVLASSYDNRIMPYGLGLLISFIFHLFRADF